MTGHACPACGCSDVSHAAGPVRGGRWWYRCRSCHFDRFGPAPSPVDPARFDRVEDRPVVRMRAR